MIGVLAMQNAEIRPYATLSKLGLAAGVAAVTLLLALLVWSAHMHVLSRIGGPTVFGAAYWLWHVGAALIATFLGGVAGAIIAAVHNVVAAKR
jgi:hypothetical protein